MRNPNGLSAAELRHLAMVCSAAAAAAKSDDARDALMRKRASLLALADNEDWLGGQRPFAEKIPERIPQSQAAE